MKVMITDDNSEDGDGCVLNLNGRNNVDNCYNLRILRIRGV